MSPREGLPRDGVDFIARLAAAWDGRGPFQFTGPERAALLHLAQIPPDLQDLFRLERPDWQTLDPEYRQAIVFGARQAVRLGRQVQWAFGVGPGQ